jgi:hypothetical protein
VVERAALKHDLHDGARAALDVACHEHVKKSIRAKLLSVVRIHGGARGARRVLDHPLEDVASVD